jgi:hypothetical protein
MLCITLRPEGGYRNGEPDHQPEHDLAGGAEELTDACADAAAEGMFGSAGLLLYAVVRADPVFILGQSLGSIVYVRNLVLIYRKRRASIVGPPAPTS